MWSVSHRADPWACRMADRHYNRQKIGSPQFVPPGRCVVLRQPQALWVTPSGSTYVGDEHNHAIRVIEPGGLIHLVAGTGAPGFSADGTPADSGRIEDPENIVVTEDGTVVFTEAGSGRVRYVGPDGRLGTIAGGAE